MASIRSPGSPKPFSASPPDGRTATSTNSCHGIIIALTDGRGWALTTVRYTLHNLEGNDRVNLAATQFPPADAVTTRCYLDAESLCLGWWCDLRPCGRPLPAGHIPVKAEAREPTKQAPSVHKLTSGTLILWVISRHRPMAFTPSPNLRIAIRTVAY